MTWGGGGGGGRERERGRGWEKNNYDVQHLASIMIDVLSWSSHFADLMVTKVTKDVLRRL